ncbi:hypothetical protein ACFE04_004760 [Oxalis oulophora]
MAALSFSCNSAISRSQVQVKVNPSNNNNINNGRSHHTMKSFLKSVGVTSIVTPPQLSLQNGNWVKLICGASFEDVVDIRNLSLVYTLAGVDCIDCAADASVVTAVNQGIEAALEILPIRRPWVMISVNDDQDLHFRKAEFDPDDCPSDCSRPCELVCPASAIPPIKEISTAGRDSTNKTGGVITERCYGCGRCFPVCPYDKIREMTYIRDSKATAKLLQRNDVDAIEIHTSGRQSSLFKELWDGLGDSTEHLRLVAVSMPYTGDTMISTMKSMYSVMEPRLCCLNLWQLDGRPMSGDIGRGATKQSIAFAVHLAAAADRPHGFLQLAGGTNAHTVNGLSKEGLFQKAHGADFSLIGGIAYGGYARKIVGRVLSSMASEHGLGRIEDYPQFLEEALKEALGLVGTVKCYNLV